MSSQHLFGDPERLLVTFGPGSLSHAKVASTGCWSCVAEPGRHLGCCAAPAHWTLADVAVILTHEPDGHQFVTRLLKTGRITHAGLAVQTRAARDKCQFHRVNGGCLLRPALRPLRCRMYLCHPAALMTADMLPHYREYLAEVQVLEEQLTWALWHRGLRLGMSSLADIRQAAQMSSAILAVHQRREQIGAD